MGGVVFALVGLVQLGTALVGVRATRRWFSWYAVLVLVVVAGLSYDNLVIAGGAALGEGAAARALNTGRFWIHALATPTLVIAAFGIARLGGLTWAASRTAHAAACTLATALVLVGAWVDVLGLALAPARADGVLRYVNTFEPLPGPPVPAVVTIVVVTAIGVSYWRATGWPWLLTGGVVMFATAGAVGRLLVQNLGEAVFAAALVATLVHANRRARQHDTIAATGVARGQG